MFSRIQIIAAHCMAGQLKNGVQNGPLSILDNLRQKTKLNRVLTEYIYGTEFYRKKNNGYEQLYNKLVKILNEGNYGLILGGDHSIAKASVAATIMKYRENTHVVWVDAHADIHTPETSISGNEHGMPVSSLLGLSKLMSQYKYKLNPSQLTYIGLRDVEPAETELIEDLNINMYTSEDVHSIGIETIMDETMSRINNTTKVHLSFDLDALDPEYIFSTGTLVEGGITFDDSIHIIERVSHNLVAADVVELNPTIGNSHQVKYSVENASKITEKILDAFRC